MRLDNRIKNEETRWRDQTLTDIDHASGDEYEELLLDADSSTTLCALFCLRGVRQECRKWETRAAVVVVDESSWKTEETIFAKKD